MPPSGANCARSLSQHIGESFICLGSLIQTNVLSPGSNSLQAPAPAVSARSGGLINKLHKSSNFCMPTAR